MYQKSTETKAAIGRGSAMETRDHSKNGVSPKNHRSRGNFLNFSNVRKILTMLVALIGFGITVNAQDIILKKDGSETKAKVLEITEQHVKYKDFDFQSGPTRNINISEVFMITYENGEKEVFNKLTFTQPPTQTKQIISLDLKKAKQLRNAGISCFAIGTTLWTIGAGLWGGAGYYYYDSYYGYTRYDFDEGMWLSGIPLVSIGSAMTVSGIIMWAIGQHRINRFNADGYSLFENEKMQLNLAVGGNYIGLKLNF
jgi:hypothetical protein